MARAMKIPIWNSSSKKEEVLPGWGKAPFRGNHILSDLSRGVNEVIDPEDGYIVQHESYNYFVGSGKGLHERRYQRPHSSAVAPMIESKTIIIKGDFTSLKRKRAPQVEANAPMYN